MQVQEEGYLGALADAGVEVEGGGAVGEGEEEREGLGC